MIFGLSFPHLPSFHFPSFSFLGARHHQPPMAPSPYVVTSSVVMSQQPPLQVVQLPQNSQQPPFVQVVQPQQYPPLTHPLPPANLVLIHSAPQYVNHQPAQTAQQYLQDPFGIFSPRQTQRRINEYYAPQQTGVFSPRHSQQHQQPQYALATSPQNYQQVQQLNQQYIQPQQHQSPQTQYVSPNVSPMRPQQPTQHQQCGVPQQQNSQPYNLAPQQQYITPTPRPQQPLQRSEYYETVQSPEQHPLQVNTNPSELSNSIQVLTNLNPDLYATNPAMSSQITPQQAYQQVTPQMVYREQVPTYEVPTYYQEVSSVVADQGWGGGANRGVNVSGHYRPPEKNNQTRRSLFGGPPRPVEPNTSYSGGSPLVQFRVDFAPPKEDRPSLSHQSGVGGVFYHPNPTFQPFSPPINISTPPRPPKMGPQDGVDDRRGAKSPSLYL